MKALITGIGGQDGTYLSALLEKLDYDVFGITSRSRISEQNSRDQAIDITKLEEVASIVKSVSPDEIYHLAAVQGSSEQQSFDVFDLFNRSYAVNVQSTLNILESVHRYSRQTKVFFASSAQIFGNPKTKPQNELTPRNPNNIYGITKLVATEMCAFYRRTKEVFVSVGILYNHESPLRGPDFVSKKIVRGVARILNGGNDQLVLGDLAAKVDWGFAPDFVDAMNKILRLDRPDEFVVATGQTHSIEDFVRACFAKSDIDWRKYVRTDPMLLGSETRRNLVGDSTKLRRMTGWKPRTTFEQMVKIMLDHELNPEQS